MVHGFGVAGPQRRSLNRLGKDGGFAPDHVELHPRDTYYDLVLKVMTIPAVRDLVMLISSSHSFLVSLPKTRLSRYLMVDSPANIGQHCRMELELVCR